MLPLLSLVTILSSLHSASAQVTATFPNGPTNPDEPSFAPVGSVVNQTSESRLITVNGVDDFCLWGPPEAGPDSLIGNVEPTVVAYCTKPRNGARLIPDGTITAAHFVKTDTYVQLWGFWDGTKVGIPDGDDGGELDPHGAEGTGNPIGGNVTTNVEGKDVFYEEWMSFISYDQFCIRICTAQANDSVTTALQCEHELDIMGCAFVMAIPEFYSTNNSFTSCEGDVAPPPGLYPQGGGSYSTFRQRYTGTYVDGAGQPGTYTVGNEVTPSAPAFYPSSSNCFTYSTISNGVDTNNFEVKAAPTLLSGSGSNEASVSTTSMSNRPTQSGSNRPSGGSQTTSGGASGASGASSGAGNAGASTSGAADTKVGLVRKDALVALGAMVPVAMLGAGLLF